MAGIREVARQAGVSTATVSNVLNRPDIVAPDTRRRVRTVIDKLGYTRQEAARQLRSGTSRVLALLLADLADPFLADVALGAQRAARRSGLGVIVCNSDGSGDKEAAYVSLLAEQRVGGVVVVPTHPAQKVISLLRRHAIPTVLVGTAVAGTGVSSVGADHMTGGRLAAEHLLAAGHRGLAYIGGPPELASADERLAGVVAALRAAGLPVGAVKKLATDRFDVLAGRDAAARLLGLIHRPTAVICANDLLALGVLQELHAARVSVPNEMAIVGYGGIECASAAAVPLTSVAQPAGDIGRVATELLLTEILRVREGAAPIHRRVVLRPELVVRGSTHRWAAASSHGA